MFTSIAAVPRSRASALDPTAMIGSSGLPFARGGGGARTASGWMPRALRRWPAPRAAASVAVSGIRRAVS